MKTNLIFLLLLISPTVFGQLKNVSFQFAGNYPIIGTETNSSIPVVPDPATGYTTTTLSYKVEESFAGRPGFDLNVNADVHQFNKFFIRTGLGISFIRFKRTITVTSAFQSIPTGFFLLPGIPSQYGNLIGGNYLTRDEQGNIVRLPDAPLLFPQPDPKIGETTTLYLSLPVVIGRNFVKDRLQVKTGIVPAILMHATEIKLPAYSFTQPTTSNYQKDSSGDGFNSLLLNLTFETSFKITKRWGTQLGALYSFSSIYDDGKSVGEKVNYAVVNAGICYHLN
ncbi:MAG: outer membrane beta-barrel protein [Cyclobacteriaceae bacterium]|nr:outer membrane beta-barrel protein [Cyclobacteriaceae bacterium]